MRLLRRAGAWNNWNIQLAPWIPALASQFTKPYTTDVTAYIVSQTALFYPTSTWGLYTSNSDLVRCSSFCSAHIRIYVIDAFECAPISLLISLVGCILVLSDICIHH